MADNLTPGPHEFSADQEKSMRAGRRKSFDPQGGNGGGVNIPGLTSDGKPARLRSESTERAQINAQNGRLGTSQPASVLGHLLSPESSAVQDAIYSKNRKALDATGPED